ncbi:GIY-YIG nuclease family protein [Arabiibacter massiliensis]|uniref:GIY-YIG nuclease family protein n=1 Tax=Arabiibacter massiliensis TaxID=1870985 RepID=UPI0009B965A3|nr:GIY-YIG nuclease family protein [Arabiibacter massiliensis]
MAPQDPQASFYLYVLECADGTWYTGYTVDVEERVRAHNAGEGAKYTRGRTPATLVASARFASKHEAMSAEYRFKRLTRRQKERLVRRAADEPFEQVLRALMPDAEEGEGPR